MKYFHGFALVDEEKLLAPFLLNEEFCVCGFSYGAIKAFEYTKQQLLENKRVDKLLLLSPAFFQTTSQKFKKLQLLGFSKSPENYIHNFIQQCFLPYNVKEIQFIQPQKEELRELLWYVWDEKEIRKIMQKGVQIEVYIGGVDAIIPSKECFEFFSSITNTTLIQKANHFLLSE